MPKNKGGRPPTAMNAIDKAEFEKLLALYPSVQDCADWFKVSLASMERYIKANYDIGFEGLRNKSFVRTKVAIKRKQVDKALQGDNTMLIWCGKQYLGQRDHQEIEQTIQQTTEHSFSQEQLDQAVALLDEISQTKMEEILFRKQRERLEGDP